MQIVSRQPSESAPARIQPLSVLPVFLDLTDKRAVVAGGTEGAAWKAELLVAAGARVEVFASELSSEMASTAQRQASIGLHRRDWLPSDLAGAAIALCDAEDETEAAAFETACRAAGAACNVIDKPAFCHFQFGSIVNRSPVVVGISTSGAAPILGQAIRRRIETLLAPSLAGWAQLAHAIRERVAARFTPGPQRRAFWERFVDQAFGPAPTAKSATDLFDRIASDPVQDGHVTFVGAGPGNAEFLTLKAVRALQGADVILFDDLVSDEGPELARREAKRILVGKRAGRPSCKQHEINAMMVKLAKSGRRVVRLKSGDPMVFGRAGEEIAELERHGLSYGVVPGITAGLAMAASLGVSLTHRDAARSVRFITGHSKHGGLPADIDWRSVADPATTTMFYMGGRTAGEISERLIAHGMGHSTPVVIAADIGRPNETRLHCDLAALPVTAGLLSRERAVLIGIGAVFGKRVAASVTPAAEARYVPAARQ